MALSPDTCSLGARVHNARMPGHAFRLPLALCLVACGSVALLPAGAVRAADSAPAKTYMWIDKNGHKQYGDSIPPEYSQNETRVLNKQGVETQHLDAPLTPAQLAEQARITKDRQDREQHDRFLLTTYTSTRDIERLRDERLVQLDGQVKAASAYIDSLDARMKALQARSQQFKPYNTSPNARRMPDDLAEQLVRGASEAVAQRRALEKQRQELGGVRAQFDADIARYRELTSHPGAT
jgi:hypothetical protein